MMQNGSLRKLRYSVDHRRFEVLIQNDNKIKSRKVVFIYVLSCLIINFCRPG